jgi:hypothetical protein
VKIVIGVFQDKDEATALYQKRLTDITSLTEVGPFFSKKQALAWLDHLKSRIQNIEIALIPESSNDSLQWYGFSFED